MAQTHPQAGLFARWFPQALEPNQGWRVDATTVVLLTLLGDRRSEEFNRAATASPLILLPRLAPAMQLLNAPRPDKLPNTTSELKMLDLSSRVTLTEVGYFVDTLHGFSNQPIYGFRVLEVRHRTNPDKPSSIPPIRPSNLVNAVLIFLFLLTLAISLAVSLRRDGPALLAICLMGLASSLIGYANSWELNHHNPTPTPISPSSSSDGNNTEPQLITRIFKTPQFGILLIRYSPQVDLELYGGFLQTHHYRAGDGDGGPPLYGLLMALGHITLMASVIMLGNASWQSQVMIASAYVLLNVLYWGVVSTLLPRRLLWDLESRFEVRDVTPRESEWADMITTTLTEAGGERDEADGWPGWVRTVWFAIRETGGDSKWAERWGYCLRDEGKWREWVREAGEAAARGDRGWRAVSRFNQLQGEKGVQG
ncbi:hypothetical protein QBC44DRAFT_357555 [Cladorrhinum sp. PSN332]|nr:hypothetical protein QBC44DRAFT_357555 [Cladorrhinum sp. PSN332]